MAKNPADFGSNDPDVSDSLFAARYVAATDAAPAKETGLAKMLRTFKKDDPVKFLGYLKSLERDYALAKKTGTGAKTSDEGTKECVALVEKLLAELASPGGETAK
jgi:hypothetical protein